MKSFSLAIFVALSGCASSYFPVCQSKCYGSDDISVTVSDATEVREIVTDTR